MAITQAMCTSFKKEILTAEIEACERSLKYASDEIEKHSIENELSELRRALDLMTW